MWPSPYEQALAESREEFTLTNSSSAEFDGEVYATATAYSDDVERSFAGVYW
ncbi:hypothetical protein PR003_g8096 [Phytophthora rubi]|uniref:Uncharacterized protein n=1 Tax=Phytophthora rubi TaxID=129364 RepID=A0A6A4FKG4_9STRA|nr:hypothetical protein PR003_g8096 [Phytophthora rubi]